LKRLRLYAVALVVTLALGGWWSWHHARALRAQAEKAVFFTYLRGPLSDYLLAANEALPVLLSRQKDPSALGRCLKEYRSAESGMEAILSALPSDDWKEFLAKVRKVHAVAAEYCAGWESAVRPEDFDKALTQEASNRGFIIQGLEAMRSVAKSRWRLTLEEELEVNALLTSLKEARAYAQKGLEGSGRAK
jgi:hypothetical protein